MSPRLFPVAPLILSVALFSSSCQPSDPQYDTEGGRLLNDPEIARLLEWPGCLERFSPSSATWIVEHVPIESKGIQLSGQLYVPAGGESWPLVIIVPGGFNEADLIMRAPRFYAPRLARCGYAAFVYWKRGVGSSGGIYAEATYDDFADDVVSIAHALAADPRIDSRRIGLYGGSGGGRVGAIAAARSGEISFVITSSAPIVSWEEENNYNIENALRMRGYADSLIERVMPLWRRHHAAWARGDSSEHETVAAEVQELRKQYDPRMLPTPFEEVFRDSGLVFLWPVFRSAHRDYLAELKSLNVPWLSIYGEEDQIVPVSSCVENILALGRGGRPFEIIVLPDVGHSFVNAATRHQVPVLNIVVNWLQSATGPPVEER